MSPSAPDPTQHDLSLLGNLTKAPTSLILLGKIMYTAAFELPLFYYSAPFPGRVCQLSTSRRDPRSFRIGRRGERPGKINTGEGFQQVN